MLALFAAVTVAATPVAAIRVAEVTPQVFLTQGAARSVCKPSGRYEIADPALLYRDDGKAKLSQLNQLPKANHEKAVLRTIDGCSAPVVVRYEAGR